MADQFHHQRDPDLGRRRLLLCGSRVLSPAETRYSIPELELLAVVYACEKCSLYLQGREFTVVTDHKPLLTILNRKSIETVTSPRLLRLRQRLQAFTFVTEWCPGKENIVPDVLSRSPVTQPDDDDRRLEVKLTEGQEFRVNYVKGTFPAREDYRDPELDVLVERLDVAAAADPLYVELRRLVTTSFDGIRKLSDMHPDLRGYFRFRTELQPEAKALVTYRSRIVVPASERREVLRLLHLPHQGITRTLLRARESVFWPGITADVTSTVESCVPCQENRPSLPAEPADSDPPPRYAFQEIAVDIAESPRKSGYWMVIVDRYSGWIEPIYSKRAFDAELTVKSLRPVFACFGYPKKIRTDGGTNFVAARTEEFFRSTGVNHAVSAPHYPQGNGLAERAVRTFKDLLHSVVSSDGELDDALLELRSTPGVDGLSPAQKVFGRPIRGLVPRLLQPSSAPLGAPTGRPERSPRSRAATPSGASPPTPTTSPSASPQPAPRDSEFKLGQSVRIQCWKSRKWCLTGNVLKIARRNLFCHVDGGNERWLNRRFVKALKSVRFGV
jgi:hypothetical protein